MSEDSLSGLTFWLGIIAAGFFFGGKRLKPLRSTLGGECVVESNYFGDNLPLVGTGTYC